MDNLKIINQIMMLYNQLLYLDVDITKMDYVELRNLVKLFESRY